MAEPVEDPTDPPQLVPATESEVDQRDLLTQKTAQASLLYAHKSYEAAAELYAEAAELQASLNGELALENADLLYAYGRCLYHVAVSKSDVLGGKVAGEKTRDNDPSKRGVKRKKGDVDGSAAAGQTAGEGSSSSAAKVTEKTEPANKPFFQIEGDDADWSSASEDDDEDAEADGAEGDAEGGDDGTAAEEEDDFATAYEILDIARVLLSRKLEAAAADARDADVGTSEKVDEAAAAAKDNEKTLRTIKESLADTHDLQSEISLESERFEAAVSDSRASLALKKELYPQDSNYVAEAHFKLSLALEFASVTQIKEEAERDGGAAGSSAAADRNAGVAGVDEEMRKEAAEHMEASIASTRMRLEREKKILAGMGSDGEASEERRAKERDVADVLGMLEEMEQRLADLRQPAISVKGLGADDADDPVKGILGSLLGESKATQKAAIDEATKGANDLSGLVKRKGKAKADEGASSTAANGNGKRRADIMEGSNGAGSDDAPTPDTKKARVEDAEDE